MSVTLPERNPLEATKHTKSTEAKVSDNHKGVISDNGNYIPQYSHIKDILLQCKSKEELAILKNTAIQVAELCGSLVSLHLAKQGPPGIQLIAELKATVINHFTTQLSAYCSLCEKCTCEGDTRGRHQALLKGWIATAENDLSKAEAILEYLSRLKMEGIEPSIEMGQTIRR
jgi:hypothetical protein